MRRNLIRWVDQRVEIDEKERELHIVQPPPPFSGYCPFNFIM